MTLSPPVRPGSKSVFGRERLPLVLAAASLVLLLVLFRGTAWSIVHLWYEDSAYSHGFLIVPLAAWLVWQRRDALLAAAPRPTAWALVPLAALCMLWLATQVVSIQVASQLTLVALADCLLLAMLGFAGFRVLLFPALFLFAAIPFGEGLTPQLQSWTANIAVVALRATGMPVFQDGLQLTTPIGDFAVADECSGLRFLTATLTLAVLFASEFYTSWRRRFAFMALALIIPIIANGLRVYTVILLARAFGIEFAASVDHVVYGWVFLSLVTGVLLLIGWSFRQPPARVSAPDVERQGGSRPRSVAIAAGAFVLLIGTTVAAASLARIPGPIAALDLPSATAPLDAAAVQSLPWQPELPGADARRFDQDTVQGRPVTRAVAYYAWQRQGAKAASDGATLAPESWTRINFGTANVTVDGQSFVAQRLVVAHGSRHWLIYSWYWVDDRFTGSAVMAKVLQIRGLLQGSNAGAAIAIAAPFDTNEDVAVAEHALALSLERQQGLSRALAHAGGI
ncbi:MAG TPA: exosortase A [Aliidongia sp.]|uniref:exosortase A n=1 Tax=Aliidongia sp. TaxID=1914230 RepID=UPI002DDD5967|nr:exosortase A [Aliidongia sp.]HEV2678768.1 exosortase A [Aliidongia sp.]